MYIFRFHRNSHFSESGSFEFPRPQIAIDASQATPRMEAEPKAVSKTNSTPSNSGIMALLIKREVF